MTNAIDKIAAPRIGQATAIEQSRAVAEVQAAVVVAQQCPRNLKAAVDQMRGSCAQLGLAERAFYRYPRGGSTITGPSVHLARELARCWGNIQYGIAELRRDDDAGYSEMQAFAWDVQTNTRSAQIFVVPHLRDKKVKGENVSERLVEMRDIYENNANNGARRLREAIFSILPPWFVEDAKNLCAETLAAGDGQPVADRIASCVAGFATIGIRSEQIEEKIGRPQNRWTVHDLAQLVVTFRSIQRGEMLAEEEFPPRRVTGAEILASRPAEPAPTPTGGAS